MTVLVAYRHAAYDTPWWAFPSSRSGRFHRAEHDTVQYLSLHPLGPAAEFLRNDVGPEGDPDEATLNLWAVLIDDSGIERVDFDNAGEFGITPDELVADVHTSCRALADRLRARGVPGVIVPSAALPGTENVVLFGVRVLHPYLAMPAMREEVPTGHLSDGARPAAEVAPLVRWLGTPHAALDQWKETGIYDELWDPLATRW